MHKIRRPSRQMREFCFPEAQRTLSIALKRGMLAMRLLREGSEGPAVGLLQLALTRALFGPLELNGVFGPDTAGALRRFQQSLGLESDGIAGEKTHAALLPWYRGYLTHTVCALDTYYRLAERYGSSVDAIRAANPTLEPENLPIGAELVIPLPFPVVPTTIPWFAELTGYCVQGLRARYPFFRSGQIGSSVLGKPLWFLELGTGHNRVLYNAAHHANEWITTPLLLKFAEELGAAALSGAPIGGYSAAEILNYATITLIPAVNPDGIDLVTGELRSGPAFEQAAAIAAAWPRIRFPEGWSANIRGVDLNLQYPAGWEQARENKAALGYTSPAPTSYVGTAPLTEPESRAMAEVTRRLSPRLTLSYHSQGQVIYWQFQDYAPPQARTIVRLFERVSGYEAADVPFISGFAGYKDYFLQDFRRPGYTVEVGRGVNPLPLEQFDTIYRDNLGILTLAALVT